MSTLIRIGDKGINLEHVRHWQWYEHNGVLQVYFADGMSYNTYNGDEALTLRTWLDYQSVDIGARLVLSAASPDSTTSIASQRH